MKRHARWLWILCTSGALALTACPSDTTTYPGGGGGGGDTDTAIGGDGTVTPDVGTPDTAVTPDGAIGGDSTVTPDTGPQPDVVQPQCKNDSDCTDVIDASLISECEKAACDPNKKICVVAPRENGVGCDDGDACTDNDECLNGTCAGDAVECNDDNKCTDDSCDPATGCVYDPNDAPCDDGELCTINDHCIDGECGGDQNPQCECTADADCDKFDDGNQCNGTLACVDSKCVTAPGTEIVCDPSLAGPCDVVFCEESTGACKKKPIPDGESCDDLNACTKNDTCSAGACKGKPVSCDDKNPCTNDSCDPDSGCVNENNTEPCDDGDLCTKDDVCKDGACVGAEDPSCQCATDDDCGAFENGNLCDGTLVCQAGKCTIDAATVVTCGDPTGPCKTKKCVPETGKCVDGNVLDGTACDDKTKCTKNDVCTAGLCKGEALVCDDKNPCTDDACDAASGCKFTNNTAACDDGSDCTLNDKCTAGACVGTDDPTCQCEATADCMEYEDGDKCNGTLVCKEKKCVLDPTSVVTCSTTGLGACFTSTCVPETGTCKVAELPDGTECTDNNKCTDGDVCKAGACKGKAVICDDGNVCTTDSCDPELKCVYTANTNKCDDGNDCTLGDQCDAGTCQGATANPDCQCATNEDCKAKEDGNLCNGTLICAGKKCVVDPASVVKCDKTGDNDCKKTLCDPAVGTCQALLVPDGKPCSDNNACTTKDSCATGECVGTGKLVCGDDNPCTTDSCVPESGCKYVDNTSACDDGDPCTGGDVCGGGVCQPGGTNLCPENCAPAYTLQCGETDSWGTTLFGSTNSVTGYTCNSDDYSGPEYAYKFDAPFDGTVKLTLSDETSLTDIIVLDDAGNGCEPSQCRDFGFTNVEVTMQKGQGYFFVVDGFDGAEGTYTITVDCTPAHEQNCSDGQDEDDDGLFDCQDDDCAAAPECAPAICSPKWTLTCGGTDKWANYKSGSTNVIGKYEGCGNPWDYADAPEYAYKFKSPVTGDVTVTLSDETSAGTDLVIIDPGAGTECDPAKCIGFGLDGATFAATKGKTYYFVVDGYSGAEGEYTISVDCPPETELNCMDATDNDGDGKTDCDDEDCADDAYCTASCTPPLPYEATCGFEETYTTLGGDSTNAVTTYSCNPNDDYSGPEYAYPFTAPYNGSLTVTLSEQEAKTDILVVEADGDACTGSACIGWGMDEVTVDIVAGKKYFLVVDGFQGAQGSYHIQVSCVADTEVDCTNGTDDDGDGLIDCEDSDCFGKSADCQAACVPDLVVSLTCGTQDSWGNAQDGSTNVIETYGCSPWGYPGPEYVYELTVDTATNVKVTLSNESAETDVIVLRDGGLGCNPATCVTYGLSDATFAAEPGFTYYVSVDGYAGAVGTYDLAVTCE